MKTTRVAAKKFLRFLEEELIPELDQNYRTSDYRILFGHSLGGLLTTHAYLQPTSAFKAFLAIDPSFGTWDSAVMDQKLANFSPESFQRYLYIATANWGKRNITNRDRHVRFFESLHRLSEEEFPVQLEYFENENHASVPPIAFYKGISAIFDGYGITYREVINPKQLQEHFTEISNRLSSEFLPPENLVNQLGYNKLRSNNETEKAQALEFFRMNTQNYPESYNAFDSLAEAYANFGNSEKALENYQQSLQLNPENEHARMQIEKLKKISFLPRKAYFRENWFKPFCQKSQDSDFTKLEYHRNLQRNDFLWTTHSSTIMTGSPRRSPTSGSISGSSRDWMRSPGMWD